MKFLYIMIFVILFPISTNAEIMSEPIPKIDDEEWILEDPVQPPIITKPQPSVKPRYHTKRYIPRYSRNDIELSPLYKPGPLYCCYRTSRVRPNGFINLNWRFNNGFINLNKRW